MSNTIYTKEYYSGSNSMFLGDYHEMAKARAVNVCDFIFNFFKPKSFMEIGCAYGAIVKEMASRGVDSFGFDICEDIKDEKNNIYVGSADNFPIKKKVDLIFSSDVIEHLTEQQALECFKQCREYGENVIHVISCAKYKDIGDASSVAGMDKGHISMYTIESWQDVFKKVFHDYTIITLQNPAFVVIGNEHYHSAALIATKNDFIKKIVS